MAALASRPVLIPAALALAVGLLSAALLPADKVAVGCLLGWVLLALAVIDQRHMVLPDELTLPLAGLGLAGAWLDDPAALPAHAAGAVLGFLCFAAVGLLYRRWRGCDGLGLGDAKLLAAAGAWVSWSGLPSVVLIAALLGLGTALVRRLPRRARLPFGPGLAAATWLVWLDGTT